MGLVCDVCGSVPEEPIVRKLRALRRRYRRRCRFSREGVLETLHHLQRLAQYGVGYRSFTEQYLDSCGVFKDAVLSILATIAKQERIRLSERTIASSSDCLKMPPSGSSTWCSSGSLDRR
jgi:DNA invertase Pin-like site-specific DNA recombinase